jgi:hypothetical protein
MCFAVCFAVRSVVGGAVGVGRSCWIRTYLLPPRAGLVDEGLPTGDGGRHETASTAGGKTEGRAGRQLMRDNSHEPSVESWSAVEIYRG